MADDYTLPKAVDFKDLSDKAKAAVVYEGRILQPKWDGCALVIKCDSGGPKALSASGKPVKSCDAIVDSFMRAVFHHPREGLRPFTACAEVWNEDMEFQEISGAFRRLKPQPHLRARWFDFAFDDEQSQPYELRTAWMLDSPWLHFAGHRICGSEQDAWDEARRWKALGGFDGAILRDPLAPFVLGRSKGDILKLKPVISHDLRCLDVATDFGEKTGRPTVALVCRWKDGKLQRVSTGLSYEQQAYPKQFINQIIEVEGMGYTKDGLLREPRFKGVRDDKLQPDF